MGAAAQGIDDPLGRWLTVPRTVAFICHEDFVLLLKRRKDSRIYPGCYNGVGGHLERGEDPASGIRREIAEETGLAVSNLRLRAIYNVDPGGQFGALLLMFTCVCRSRDLARSSHEGDLHWVRRMDLMSLPLVEDLPRILPRILEMADDDPPLYVHAGYDQQDRLELRIAQEASDCGQDR